LVLYSGIPLSLEDGLHGYARSYIGYATSEYRVVSLMRVVPGSILDEGSTG